VDFLNEERVQLEQKLERYEEHGPSRLEDKEEVMAQKEETQRMRTLFDAAKVRVREEKFGFALMVGGEMRHMAVSCSIIITFL
jgi:hypothetical protein